MPKNRNSGLYLEKKYWIKYLLLINWGEQKKKKKNMGKNTMWNIAGAQVLLLSSNKSVARIATETDQLMINNNFHSVIKVSKIIFFPLLVAQKEPVNAGFGSKKCPFLFLCFLLHIRDIKGEFFKVFEYCNVFFIIFV